MAIEQFILLPQEGLHATDGTLRSVLASLPIGSAAERIEARLPTDGYPVIRILDTIQKDGPRLIEMEAVDAQAVNSRKGSFRLASVIDYEAPEPVGAPDPADLGTTAIPGQITAPTSFVVECLEHGTGRPIPDVLVVAAGSGLNHRGVTDRHGRISLTLTGGSVERLWAFTGASHWGAYRTGVPIHQNAVVQLSIARVTVPYADAIARYYCKQPARFNPSIGVTVAVIDSGVGPHSSINLIGGHSAVVGEQASDFEDWKGHGTHVAGLIGASSSAQAGVRGIAPGVRIFSFRVFGHNANTTNNYSIMKAIVLSEANGCDIINLSLGGGPYDPEVERAIRDAREHGMLVVVAAGNNNRQPVNYPAAYPGAVAVSALGAVGCFPTGSSADCQIVRPPSSSANPDEFIAGFSNIGSHIAVTAPGVGVISTLPNNGYGALSGTSMAAPVVAGAAASLLSRAPEIYQMGRNRHRSDVLERLLQSACMRRGFGLFFEGYGLPDPGLV